MFTGKRNGRRGRLFPWLVGAVWLAAWLAPACTPARDESEQARRELEQHFEESMAGVMLEGTFTVSGSETPAFRKERYAIESVSKLAGDLWTFQARIQYGERDITLPVPVKILWAGDTPVVTLTDATIPGLGSFTARVLFYRDHYAGFWSHGETSGHQFGRILRPVNGEAKPVEP